jgi:hypothetical protein
VLGFTVEPIAAARVGGERLGRRSAVEVAAWPLELGGTNNLTHHNSGPTGGNNTTYSHHHHKSVDADRTLLCSCFVVAPKTERKQRTALNDVVAREYTIHLHTKVHGKGFKHVSSNSKPLV